MVTDTSRPARRLYRSRKHRLIAGVCGGLGEYFNVDPVLIRLIWVVLCFVWGLGLFLSLIAWIIIPPAADYVDVESVVHPAAPSQAVRVPTPAFSGRNGAMTFPRLTLTFLAGSRAF